MENPVTFENLPAVVSKLFDKVSKIELLLTNQLTGNRTTETDCWFTIAELCDDLPGKPAKATIYGKVQRREIPHKKFGKRLAFLKSEIDLWLKNHSRQTNEEIKEEAEKEIKKK